MIIKKIKLDPFGNLSGESFEFEEGTTNLLLGETGAGKTTVFDALYSALFIDSMVRRNGSEYKDYVKKRYPLDGGNMVKVSLEFEHDGEEYELTKKWCENKDKSEAILKGSSFSKLVGDEEVNEQLGEILPTNKGTFKNVLMAYQTGIQEVFTIEDDEVYSELDERLRENLKTDGVSPKEFLKSIEEEHEDYAKRWNFEKGRPERKSNGGLFKQNVGKIYEVYKKKKNLEDRLKEVREREKTIGQKNKELNELNEELDEVDEFLQNNKKAYDDADKKTKIEMELENKKEKFERLKKDFEFWEDAKETRSTKKGELTVLKDNLEDKKEEKENLEKQLELKEISKDIENEREKVHAGKLDGKIEAREKVDIQIQKDMESGIDEHTLEEGNKKELEADSRIEIKTDPLEVEIQSGEGKFDERVEKIESLQEKKEQKAEEYGIQLPVEKEALEEKEENIIEEIREIQCKIDKADTSISKAKMTIDDIKERHNVDSLSEIGDKKSDIKKYIEELEEKLEELEDVPDQYSETPEFRDEYEKYRDIKKDELTEEKTRLLKELKDIDSPDTPSEELGEELEAKKREFQQTLKKGKAYRYLKEKTEELMESGNLIYGQLKESIEEYFNRIYGDAFKGVNMDEMDVEGVSHPEGYDIKRDYLSTGQKDITALSIRLAMADYHLGDDNGFMVMDDPLVNIDSRKRENAAEVIEDVAENKQIIMMTCNPEHAELFSNAKKNEVER